MIFFSLFVWPTATITLCKLGDGVTQRLLGEPIATFLTEELATMEGRRGAFTVKYNKRRKQNRGLNGAEKCASRFNSQAPARLRISRCCASPSYRDQSCTARGSISPLTAKVGQILSSGGDRTDACLGQGVQHLGSSLHLDPEQESSSGCYSQESGCYHHKPGSI